MSTFPDTNVTITSYRNTYIYSQSILWAAYGIAIAVTLISDAVGVIVYFLNAGSYTTKFSTILRVTYTAAISTDLNSKENKRVDPMPEHIAEALITLGAGEIVTKEETGEGKAGEQRDGEERARDDEASSNVAEAENESRQEAAFYFVVRRTLLVCEGLSRVEMPTREADCSLLEASKAELSRCAKLINNGRGSRACT